VEVYSSHWIKNPDFAEAIQRFLNQETTHVKEYIKLSSNKLPYKDVN